MSKIFYNGLLYYCFQLSCEFGLMICNNQINNYLFVTCYQPAQDFDVAAGFQVNDEGIATDVNSVRG